MYKSVTSGGSNSTSNPYIIAAGPGVASCTGTMTAHFHWVGSGVRPKVIVVKQVASASWSGDSGNCSTGLTPETVVSTSQYGKRVTATKYKVYTDPAADFDVPLAPTASSTKGNNLAPPPFPGSTAPTPPSYGFSTVSYDVSYTPISLTLSGTKEDLNHDTYGLIGKKVTGTPNVGAYTISQPFWDVPLTTFHHFDVPSDQSTGMVVGVPSASWHSATCWWRWRDESSDGKVPVRFSADLYDGGIFAVHVVVSKEVTVLSPSFDSEFHEGGVQVNTSLFGENVTTETDGQIPGMLFKGKVATPPIFSSYNNPGQPDTQWNFTQLIDVSRLIDNASGPDYSFHSPAPQLDSSMPYGLSVGQPAQYSAEPIYSFVNGVVSTQMQDWQISGDSPASDITGSLSFLMSDQFEVYMLYRPDANVDSSTPLLMSPWSWYAYAARTSTSVEYPRNPGLVNKGAEERLPSHPYWESKLMNIDMEQSN